MNTTSANTLSWNGAGTATDEAAAKGFHVTIAHDDYAAYVRAMRMLTNSFFGRDDLAACRLRTWRFEELGEEIWRKRAAAEAGRVDVVVVSMSARGELPDRVNGWLSDCFVQRHHTPTAVIALCEAVNDFEVPWRGRLRQAAAEAGLDFVEAGMPTELKSA